VKREPLVLLAVVLAASVAQANPRAEAAYEEGRRFYDLQEWDQAIEQFKEAYKLRPSARSLFNIAQAYRLKGDCTSAMRFYKTFKRNYPAERNVDKFITDMKACAKSGAKPVASDPPEPTQPDPAQPEPAQPDPAQPEPAQPEPAQPEPAQPQPMKPEPVVSARDATPGRGMRIGGLATAGVGALILGGGAYFGLRARSIANDIEAKPVWDPDLDERGRRFERNGMIMMIGGGAMVVAGGVLYVLGRTSGTEHPGLSFVPAHDGGSLVWAGGF
jgi:tetratricopeptide (TPR) repeat protein